MDGKTDRWMNKRLIDGQTDIRTDRERWTDTQIRQDSQDRSFGFFDVNGFSGKLPHCQIKACSSGLTKTMFQDPLFRKETLTVIDSNLITSQSFNVMP